MFWWVCNVAVIALVLANDKQQWITTYFDAPFWLYKTQQFVNGFASGFLPFASLYEGREHLAFFLLISLATLAGITWHLLVTLRRHGKN